MEHLDPDDCSSRLLTQRQCVRPLMCASGVPTAEKPQAREFFLMSHSHNDNDGKDTWTRYKQYRASMSILISIPRTLYRPLPRLLKKTVLFDFPWYQFNKNTDGKAALEAEHRRESDR